MKQYRNLLENILADGEEINTERTGVGTIATFGEQIKFDLRNGFPAVTTKKLAWKSVVSELLWFLKGSDNVHELRSILHGKENEFNLDKKTIWDANYNSQGKSLNYDAGFMGDIYGVQWRQYDRLQATVGTQVLVSPGIDQISTVLAEAKVNPQSRRLLVTAWNPRSVWEPSDNEEIDEGTKPVLPPCHYGFQINISNGYIDLLWTQRSVDAFLGLPFNIASYGLLLCIFGRILGYTPRYLTGQLGNTHIYQNHLDAVQRQLKNEPYPLPKLYIDSSIKDLDDVLMSSVSDYMLDNYKHHATIKAEMAV